MGVSLERPDFPYYGLVKESFERFTTTSFTRTGPFYYYVPVILAACFPWSCLLPGAAWLAWQRRSRWTRDDRLLVVWAIAVPAFFSISQSKLSGYVLSATVALGILVARLFDRALDEPGGTSARVVGYGCVVLVIASGAAAAWIAIEVSSPGSLASYFDIRSSDYERAKALFPGLLTTSMLLAAISLAAVFTRKVAIALGGFLLFPVCLLTVLFPGLKGYSQEASSLQLAREVEAVAPEATVACLECYPPGLAFYLRRELVLVTVDGKETTSNYIPFYLTHNKPWPSQVISASRIREWLRARRGAVFLLARGEHVLKLQGLATTTGGTVRALSRGWHGLHLRPRRTS